MSFYQLYLDETKLCNKKTKMSVYGVAGVIIKNDDLTSVRKDLAKLKYNIWNTQDSFEINPKDRLFHEAEIRGRGNDRVIQHLPYYSVFKKRKKIKDAVKGIGDIISKNNLPILGAVVDLNSISTLYRSHQDSYTSYYICLKNIIENYTNYLNNFHGTGGIILESRKNSSSNILDTRIKKQVFKILSHGTLRYSATELQQVITGVRFISKNRNEAGLQIADFIPRPLVLHYAKIKQSNPSIYQIIRQHRYAGPAGAQLYASLGVVLIN